MSSSPGASSAIFLTGFMGSGKSAVGRELARRLGRPFIDLDRLVEHREGRCIADIFNRDGEPGFRDAERRALAALALDRGPVVATGGGIVIDPENRRFMACHGVVVWLECPLPLILDRLRAEQGEPRRRPLFSGDRRETERLFEQRRLLYAASADLTVEASPAVAEVAADIASRLEERTG